MKNEPDFILCLLAASFLGYLGFGGLGLLLVALLAFAWKLAPYRRGAHGDTSETWHAYNLIGQDIKDALPGTPKPLGFFRDLLLVSGLIVLGLLRFERPGLVGPLLFG